MRKLSLEQGLEEARKRISELKKKKSVVLVAVAGGSCSGKGFFAEKLGEKIIPLDDYYVGVDFMKDKSNFDCPEALDLKLLKENLLELKKGHSVKKPLYDFKTHKRKGFEEMAPADVLVVEGLFALHSLLSELFDLRIWVESVEEKRLQRRLERDKKERGWTRKEILKQWKDSVQPMHLKHVFPTKKKAELAVKN